MLFDQNDAFGNADQGIAVDPGHKKKAVVVFLVHPDQHVLAAVGCGMEVSRHAMDGNGGNLVPLVVQVFAAAFCQKLIAKLNFHFGIIVVIKNTDNAR